MKTRKTFVRRRSSQCFSLSSDLLLKLTIFSVKVNQNVSTYSSTSGDDFNEDEDDIDETSVNDSSKKAKEKRSRKPFLFEILMYNVP